ncbi:SatD family protein [Nesterenkonia sphaerica]|uniref:SatD family protein n=1 Tax=Nesterenkonia sphaerica TaxID=1804988 RepID=A0A5R9AKY5_9MICC|nr:SatD family protein [Nesterenkonia sphaerica]TLP79361.1 hypothetical protein FEF27_01800 [Nesterenkonia sphaerica]
MTVPVALIADVIGSREHPDRYEVQRAVEDTLARISKVAPPVQDFHATVGDEFQALYPSRHAALRATLFAGLLPQQGPLLRFGLGQGEVGSVPSRTSERIEDGPGWWRAREAIESVTVQQRRFPFLRSWFISETPEQDVTVNAYLLTRDQLLDGLSVRARDYARSVAQGASQKHVAAEHGVSQPAVSKLLRESGAAALLEGFRMLS